MSLGSFLTDETLGGNWADDVDELPSGPSSSAQSSSQYDRPAQSNYRERPAYGGGGGGDRDRDRSYERRDFNRPVVPVPDRPPYTAFLGNLNFETSEQDVNTLFRDLRISNVRLIRGQDERPKGFGYIEFGDRESLVDALKFNGESLNGRNIKIDVAEPPKEGSRRDDSRSDNAGDWRSEARALSPRRDNRDGGFRDGGFRDGGRDGGYRDGGFRDGGRDGGYRDGGRDGGFRGGDRGGFRDGGRDRSRGGFAGRAPPQERKPMVLLPRNSDTSAPSTPVESTSETSSPVTNKPNPFGAARPRDEAEIQRRFEERQKQKQEEKQKLEEEAANKLAEAEARKVEELERKRVEDEIREKEAATAAAEKQKRDQRRPSSPSKAKKPAAATPPAPSRADEEDNWRASAAPVTNASTSKPGYAAGGGENRPGGLAGTRGDSNAYRGGRGGRGGIRGGDRSAARPESGRREDGGNNNSKPKIIAARQAPSAAVEPQVQTKNVFDLLNEHN